MSQLTWSEPGFSSEPGSMFKYEASLQNQNGELLFNSTTIETYQQFLLPDTSICDNITAIVTAVRGQYNSSKSITNQYTGGNYQ